jgi:L-lysine 2,3-aminomutase
MSVSREPASCDLSALELHAFELEVVIDGECPGSQVRDLRWLGTRRFPRRRRRRGTARVLDGANEASDPRHEKFAAGGGVAGRHRHRLVRWVHLVRWVVVSSTFPTFVPPALLARIRRGDPTDPILRQVLPAAAEDEGNQPEGYSRDPLAEFSGRSAVPHPSAADSGGPSSSLAALEAPGARMIKKYPGRALLITTGACGVHCRYCFRRHFPYPAAPQQQTRWEPWLQPVAADPTISEVILSGGDPLVLSDASLERLAQGLRAIPHVRWLRIHSRMPVVIPQRVTGPWLDLWQGFAAKTMVIHANHANELDERVASAMSLLRRGGFQVLNQAVLLRGVNDSVQALADLSRRLIECGVTPYYLHQLDRVSGASHFEVPVAEGLRMVEQLRQRLPGYAVPRYVQEIPGELSKRVLA